MKTSNRVDKVRNQKNRKQFNQDSFKLLSLYQSFRHKNKNLDKNENILEELYNKTIETYPELLEIDLKTQYDNDQYKDFLFELRELPIHLQEKKIILNRVHEENKARKLQRSIKSKNKKNDNIGSIAFNYFKYVSF